MHSPLLLAPYQYKSRIYVSLQTLPYTPWHPPSFTNQDNRASMILFYALILGHESRHSRNDLYYDWPFFPLGRNRVSIEYWCFFSPMWWDRLVGKRPPRHHAHAYHLIRHNSKNPKNLAYQFWL